MPNNYYNFPVGFVPGTKVRSEEVNVQYQGLETAFDLLPTEVAAMPTGTATWAGDSAGAGDAYEVAMPNTRTASVDGEEIVWRADRNNTGPATINVDGLGAFPIVRADGSALAADDIVDNLMYIVRWYAADSNWQLMVPSASYLTDAAASAAAAAASAGAASTSASNAATSEGNAATSAGDASTSAGLAMEWAVNPIDDDVTGSGGAFSSLHWAAGSAEWATRAEDSLIPANFGGNEVDQYSAFHWAQKAAAASGLPISAAEGDMLYYDADGSAWTAAQGLAYDDSAERIRLIGTGNADPTVPNAVDSRLVLYSLDGNEYGQIGFTGATTFDLISRAHGAGVRIRAEDSVGSVQDIFFGDPDSIAVMYYDGLQRLRTESSGVVSIRSDGNTDTEVRELQLQRQDGTVKGHLGFSDADGDLHLRNVVHGGDVQITAENAGGSLRNHFLADPDLGTFIQHPSDNGIRIATEASGIVGLRSAGSTDTENRELRLQHQDGTIRARIGHAAADDNLYFRNSIHGGTVRLEGEDNSGTVQPLMVADPDGAALAYYNGIARFATQISGQIAVRSDGNTDAENRSLLFQHQNGTGRGFVGHGGNTSLRLENQIHGGNVVLDSEDSGGNGRLLLIGQPDASVDIYHPASNGRVMFTHTEGIHVESRVSDTPFIGMFTQAAARTGYWYTGASFMDLVSEVHGVGIRLLAEDAGGTVRTILEADPDAATTLRGDTNLSLQVAAGENAFVATANAGVDFYYNNIRGLTLSSTNLQVISTADDNPYISFYQDDQATRNGYLQFRGGGSGPLLESEDHGGIFQIILEDSGGTDRTVLSADPDGNTVLRGDTGLSLQCAAGETAIFAVANSYVQLYDDNIGVFRTDATGVFVADAAGDDPTIGLYSDAFATRQAYIQANNSAGTGLVIQQELHGGLVQIRAEDNGGTNRTILNADPDAATILNGDTSIQLEVLGVNMLVGSVGAGVDLYFAGTAEFQTRDRGSAGQLTGANVTNGSGVMKNVGLAVVENDLNTFNTAATHTPFQLANAHENIYWTGSGASNFDTYPSTGSNQTNISEGAMWFVQNNGSGTLTIRGGSGVTIRFWSGAGAAPADVDVSVTRGGIATVRKVANAVYDVWGIGLS